MKLGILKTIQREDLSRYGELPDWINAFLQALNQFMTSVGGALKGNLTFQDNFLCKVRTLTFSHGVEQKINPESKLKVTGVFPVYASGNVVDKFGWAYKTDGTIGVTFYFNSSTDAECTVIILLG